MTDKIIRPPFIGVIGLQSPVLREVLVREWNSRRKPEIPHVLQVGITMSWRTLNDRRSDLYRVCPNGFSDATHILGEDVGLLHTLHYIDDSDSGGEPATVLESVLRALQWLSPRLDAIQFDRLPHSDVLRAIWDKYRPMRIICRIGKEEVESAWRRTSTDGPQQTPEIIRHMLAQLSGSHFYVDDVLLDWWDTHELRRTHLTLHEFVHALRGRYPDLGVAIGNLDAGWLGNDQVEPLLMSGPPVSLQGMARLRRGGELSELDRDAALHFVRMAAHACAKSA